MSSSVSRDCSPPMVTHIGTTVTPLASARDVGNEAALSVTTATVSSWPLVAGPPLGLSRVSRSNSKRLRYTAGTRSARRGIAQQPFRERSVRATADAARQPALPCTRATTGTKTTSATKLPIAVSPAILPSARPATRTPEPTGAVTNRAPIAGEIPRPPAPPRTGDQLWPMTAAPPASAAAPGWPTPREQRPDGSLRQLEDTDRNERPGPGHGVQPAPRNGAAAHGPQVHPSATARHDVGKRDGSRR